MEPSGHGVRSVARLDLDKLRDGARLLIEGLGLDPDEPAMSGTPHRVARMLAELSAGVGVDPASMVDEICEEPCEALVLVRNIPFASLCQDHLLPYVGQVHLGYLPDGGNRVAGADKLARAVEVAARRPGRQERLTEVVADVIVRALRPRGAIVLIRAEQTCMTVRGVRKSGATVVTSAVRGIIRDDPEARSEAISLLYPTFRPANSAHW